MPRKIQKQRGVHTWAPTRGRGLRNRGSKRPGTYSNLKKGRMADYYGSWQNGVRIN